MKPWNTKGIEGIARFLRKAWRLVIDENGGIQQKISPEATLDRETGRVLHATIRKVTEDYEALAFNTAISQMMICLNHLAKANGLPRETVQDFLRLLAPLAPHIAEELWQRLGHEQSIALAGWPGFDPAKLVEESIKIVFQVNGKYRADQCLPAGTSKEDAIAAARCHERVLPHIEGKSIKREIYVPGKIVNIVAQ